MHHHDLEAALTWDDDRLSGAVFGRPGMSRRLRLEEPERDGFGLLETGDDGCWILCIPAGASASAQLEGRSVDLRGLRVEPSGERRLPICAGLSARVEMGDFRFEVRS